MNKLYLIFFTSFLFCLTPALSQVFSIPYTDNFETGAPGWNVVNTGIGGWELGTPNFGSTNSAHSGNNCWDIELNSGYPNTTGASLYSPAINVAGAPVIKISFWQNRNVEQDWDGFRLEYAFDTTGAWTMVGSANSVGALNWYNSPALYSSAQPAWTGNSNGWQLSSILFSALWNQEIYFRFIFTSDQSVTFDGVSIDDFSVEWVSMNSITGTVFIDENFNNIIDAGDLTAQNIAMNSIPSSGYYYTPTDANGNYSFFADSGVTTVISPVLPPYCTAIPPDISVNIPGSSQVSSGNDFLLTFQPGVTDPGIIITTTPVRPGFSHYKTLDLSNSGTTWVSGTVELTYDAAYTLVYTSVPYTVIGTNVIEFTYTALLPGEHRFILIEFSTSPSLPAGQQTTASVVVYPVNGDQNTTNNYSSVTTTTVNSCDPNNKLVDPEGDILIQDVASGIDLHYTINFQNTGTAPATYVNIFDMIDDDLDLSTFRVTGSSHPLTSWNIGSNRQAQFSFVNINLPDSNSNELESHGFVSYEIQPLTSLSVGAEITNTASIVFDFNQPVITNTVSTVVVAPTGIHEQNNTIHLYPNPANDLINFTAPSEFSHYRIMNATGQKVAEGRIDSSGQMQSVSVAGLSPGLYVLIANDKNSISKTPFMIE